MLRNQFSIGIVDQARDLRLMVCIREENIRRRERDNLNIDTHAIHVFKSLRHVGHGRRDAKETRAAIGDNRLPTRTLVEREFGREFANLFKVGRRIVMCVQIEFTAWHDAELYRLERREARARTNLSVQINSGREESRRYRTASG